MRRWTIAVGLLGLGLTAGVLTLTAAHDHPAYGFAGSSRVAGAALLGAGWALIGCGLAFWLRRPSSRCGPLLTAAGFAWFVPEWNNPELGSSLAFTAALVLSAACPPLVAHAVLAYPGGRLPSRASAVAVGAAYGGALLVGGVGPAGGLGPAVVFDPRAEGCGDCPRNLMLVNGVDGAAEDLTRIAVYLGLAWAAALAVFCASRLVRGSRSARPVVTAGAVYLGLVAATYASALDRGFVTNGALERRLWLGQAAALLVLVGSIAWALVRARRARAAVARVVVELTQSPPPGGLRAALAAIAGDPTLEVAYPVGEEGRLVDARGQPLELAPGSETTRIVREEQTVAVLAHRPGVLDDQPLVDEVSAAARLALENERLESEVRARLEELRASRSRIVEAGDAERRRFERDLHDGAQQRLIGLSLSLGLLRGRATRADGPLAEAEAELRQAAVELRELAHGIFPAVLADEGLAAALEALAEEGRVPIRIENVPETRFDAPIETAAYTVVAEAARTATAPLTVAASTTRGTLVVEVETAKSDELDVTFLEDRIGALDGRLAVVPGADGEATIRAELPCES
jgi:signal transduction histidine kinase